MDTRAEVDRFSLSRCPDSAWTLPKEVKQGQYTLRGSKRKRALSFALDTYCPRPNDFLAYLGTAKDEWDDPLVFDARLNRGPSCTLDIVHHYLVPLHATPEQARAASRGAYLDQRRRYLSLVSRLLVEKSGAAPSPQPAAVAQFDQGALRAWCGTATSAPLPADSG
jgi:hypothetical protein